MAMIMELALLLVLSVQFLKDNDDYEIILVGDESSINVELKKIEGIPDSLRIVNNPNLPSDVKNIHKSLRENTSMNTAIDLVVDGKADAVISKVVIQEHI